MPLAPLGALVARGSSYSTASVESWRFSPALGEPTWSRGAQELAFSDWRVSAATPVGAHEQRRGAQRL